MRNIGLFGRDGGSNSIAWIDACYGQIAFHGAFGDVARLRSRQVLGHFQNAQGAGGDFAEDRRRTNTAVT